MGVAKLYAVAVLIVATLAGGARTAVAQEGLPSGARLRLGTLNLRHTAKVSGIVFSPDGKTVFAGQVGRVFQWDLKTGKEFASFQGDFLALSPNGKTLAIGRRISGIQLVDVATGAIQHSMDTNQDWVRCAVFSPDGTTLYGGGGQRVIYKWQVDSGRLLGQFNEKIAGTTVIGLFMAADGKTCLSHGAGINRTLQVWDVAAGTPLRQIGDTRDVEMMTATRDGKTILASPSQVIGSSKSGDIRVFETTTGKERQYFRTAAVKGIRALAISPDGKIAAIAGVDNALRLYDLDKEKEIPFTLTLSGPVESLAFSADGKTLAAGGWNHVVRLWDWQSSKELFDQGHLHTVTAVAFTPDGKTVVSQSLDHTVRLWEPLTGKERHRFTLQEKDATYRTSTPIFRSPDGKSFFTSTLDNVPYALELLTGNQKRLEFVPKESVPAALSADGKKMITYHWSEPEAKVMTAVTFTLWDLGRSQKIREFTHSFKGDPKLSRAGATVGAVAISPDGKTIATSWVYQTTGPMNLKRGDHGVSLWDVDTGSERRMDAGAALTLAFQDDGKTLVCLDGDSGRWARAMANRNQGVMEFWDVAVGKKTKTFKGPPEWGMTLALSPDGKYFATASHYVGDAKYDHSVYLWRTATGEQVKKLGAHQQQIDCVAFSQDGRTLASGSRDTTILLWDVADLR